jgi:hypothetical protein
VLDLIAGDMVEVDRVIAQRLDTGVPLVSQVSKYIISAGGKRLRPALLLLMSGALGYTGEQRFNLAAVVEFIHTATLLHDDVVDESTLRRGRATANESFGNPASVLVGDFLYSRAFQMMLDANNMRVMQILAEATNVIAEGEVLQLMNMHDASLDEEAYLRVIRSKTAKLFEASTRLAAVLAGATPQWKRLAPPTAKRWAPPSRSSTTCSTMRATSRKPGRTSATTCAKARPPCRSFSPCSAAPRNRARSCAPPLKPETQHSWARSSRSCAKPAPWKPRARRPQPKHNVRFLPCKTFRRIRTLQVCYN